MKKYITLFLFLILQNIYAEDKNIVCGFQQCSPDFNPSLYLEQSDQTIINIGNNSDNINIELPVNQQPRSLFLSVNNNTLDGVDLNADLSSKLEENDTKEFILIGDIFNDLNVSLNGYDGQQGQDASIICANRFLDGSYGETSRQFFLSRRQNQNIPQDRCDEQDVRHIQNSKFSCQENDFSLTNISTVEVERVQFKQRCIGTSIRYKCLQRKVKIACEWAAYPRGFPLTNKYTNLPCSNRWGGSNCDYRFGDSCWRGRDLSASYSNNTILSYAPDNVSPKWIVSFDDNRCTFPRFGGAFAYQQSFELSEARYLDALNRDALSELCTSDFPGPPAPAWRFNQVNEAVVTSPGLDPDTLLPLPGSNWDVQFTDFFEPCSSLGSYETLNSEIETWTAFGNPENNCSDANIPEDTNNLIPWNPSGVVQDPTFGTENLLCNPDNCPVQSLTREIDFNFDEIDPTSGANGTKQGTGVLFLYDYNQLNAQARAGLAGLGGNNDLPLLEETKYCVKIDDASSKGIDSSFAKNPVVNFNIYNWEGLKVNRGQPGGQVPDFSNNSIKIYRKLDSSFRYYLQQTMLE